MKSLRSLSVLTAALVLSIPVLAQSATKNVVVSANLTSLCRFVNSDALTIALAYTAFQTGDASNTGTAGIECTRHTTTPGISFNETVGIVAGLTYVLSNSYAAGVAGDAPDGTAGSLGTPRTGTVTVTATIPGGQAGAGAGGVTAATAKVMTVTF